MVYSDKKSFKQETTNGGKAAVLSGNIPLIRQLTGTHSKFSEREKRGLLFCYITGGIYKFLDVLGIEIDPDVLERKIIEIMEDEEEFYYLLGDEIYVSITEAAEIFNIKTSRLNVALKWKNLEYSEKIAAAYTHTGRGMRKMKHVKLPEVAVWLDGRNRIEANRENKSEKGG